MTACVHILHRKCGGVLGVAVPDGEEARVVVNEHVTEGLDEIRAKAAKVSPHAHRRMVTGWWRHYPSPDALPERFVAWCTGCEVVCEVDGHDIEVAVAKVAHKKRDFTLRVV